MLDSRWPPLRGLDGEEGEHGGGDVVVVELLLGPLPADHLGRLAWLPTELEIFSLQGEIGGGGERIRLKTNLTLLCTGLTDVVAEKEFPVKKLDSHHGENEEKEEIDN